MKVELQEKYDAALAAFIAYVMATQDCPLEKAQMTVVALTMVARNKMDEAAAAAAAGGTIH